MQWWRGAALVFSSVLAGCGVTQDEFEAGQLRQAAKTQNDPGALVKVNISSQVGVVLDELPAAQRDRLAAQLLSKPSSYWTARAQRQLEHTNYRLIYRGFFYGPATNAGGSRRMMPITRPELWNITFTGSPVRTTLQGHDVVSVPFTMNTTVLTDAASPGSAEPNLQNAGGTWDEPYSLPLDPEGVFQRTGYACVDEDGYPLGTADSENSRNLFDHTCGVETVGREICHHTLPYPTESCVDALTRATGRIDTALHFERLAWNATTASAVRTGTPIRDTADLVPRLDGLQENRIIYRYIEPGSCAIEERCVGGSGWRRLLQFTASIQNKGAKAMAVGSTDATSPLRLNNDFEFSACHGHFHFSHYGAFQFGTFPGDKRAFCVESTARWFNNEAVPLVHPFSCENQGVATGWGDDYIAGVECQWVDITDVPAPKRGTTTTLPLSFQFNPDRFLCEGTPVLDASGNQLFEPTTFVTETGAPVNRPMCTFASGALDNNLASTPVTVPVSGGFVTAACTRGQSGGKRDCGFQETSVRTCVPGARVTLSCTSPATAKPQVLRVCEASARLGGTACVFRESLANADVTSAPGSVSFTCPTARDATEPGGRYALYTGAQLDGDAAATVTCN